MAAARQPEHLVQCKAACAQLSCCGVQLQQHPLLSGSTHESLHAEFAAACALGSCCLYKDRLGHCIVQLVQVYTCAVDCCSSIDRYEFMLSASNLEQPEIHFRSYVDTAAVQKVCACIHGMRAGTAYRCCCLPAVTAVAVGNTASVDMLARQGVHPGMCSPLRRLLLPLCIILDF